MTVPTLDDLAREGLATRLGKTEFRVSDAGHAKMGDAMRAAGKAAQAAGAGDWTQPPSNGIRREESP